MAVRKYWSPHLPGRLQQPLDGFQIPGEANGSSNTKAILYLNGLSERSKALCAHGRIRKQRRTWGWGGTQPCSSLDSGAVGNISTKRNLRRTRFLSSYTLWSFTVEVKSGTQGGRRSRQNRGKLLMCLLLGSSLTPSHTAQDPHAPLGNGTTHRRPGNQNKHPNR